MSTDARAPEPARGLRVQPPMSFLLAPLFVALATCSHAPDTSNDIPTVDLPPATYAEYFLTAWDAARDGNLEASALNYLAALELSPGNATIAVHLASLSTQSGRMEAAWRWLDRAVDWGYDAPTVLEHDPNLAALRNDDPERMRRAANQCRRRPSAVETRRRITPGYSGDLGFHLRIDGAGVPRTASSRVTGQSIWDRRTRTARYLQKESMQRAWIDDTGRWLIQMNDEGVSCWDRSRNREAWTRRLEGASYQPHLLRNGMVIVLEPTRDWSMESGGRLHAVALRMQDGQHVNVPQDAALELAAESPNGDREVVRTLSAGWVVRDSDKPSSSFPLHEPAGEWTAAFDRTGRVLHLERAHGVDQFLDVVTRDRVDSQSFPGQPFNHEVSATLGSTAGSRAQSLGARTIAWSGTRPVRPGPKLTPVKLRITRPMAQHIQLLPPIAAAPLPGQEHYVVRDAMGVTAVRLENGQLDPNIHITSRIPTIARDLPGDSLRLIRARSGRRNVEVLLGTNELDRRAGSASWPGGRISPDGNWIAVATDAFTMRFQPLDRADQRAGHVVKLRGGALQQASWSPDSLALVTVTKSMCVQIWDPRTGSELVHRDYRTGSGFGAAISWGERLLAVEDPWDQVQHITRNETILGDPNAPGHGQRPNVPLLFLPGGRQLLVERPHEGGRFLRSEDHGRGLWRPIQIEFPVGLTRFTASGQHAFIDAPGPGRPGSILRTRDGAQLNSTPAGSFRWTRHPEVFVGIDRIGTYVLDAGSMDLRFARFAFAGGRSAVVTRGGHFEADRQVLLEGNALVDGLVRPLESIASVLLDPMRVRTAGAGHPVPVPVFASMPTIYSTWADGGSLRTRLNTRHVEFSSNDSEGVVGFHVEIGGKLQPLDKVRSWTRFEQNGRRAVLRIPLHVDKLRRRKNRGYDVPLRVRAIGKSGVHSESRHVRVVFE